MVIKTEYFLCRQSILSFLYKYKFFFEIHIVLLAYTYLMMHI